MTGVDPITVSPAGLVDAMKQAGFTAAGGGRPGSYVRMRWPAGTGLTWMLVPLDPTAADFADLMGPVLTMLAASAVAGKAASTVLAAVASATRP